MHQDKIWNKTVYIWIQIWVYLEYDNLLWQGSRTQVEWKFRVHKQSCPDLMWRILLKSYTIYVDTLSSSAETGLSLDDRIIIIKRNRICLPKTAQ